MIGYLSGEIKSKTPDGLIVNVSGVGYLVYVPVFVWQNAEENQGLELMIYTHVKEDEISLYGFNKLSDKRIFESLISVSGIGPRLALAILSHAQTAGQVVEAISQADVDFFKAVKGVGKKSAQRIIVDLKSKVGGIKDLEFEAEVDQDLKGALENLGFSSQEIKKAVKGIDDDLDLQERIKLALKNVNQ